MKLLNKKAQKEICAYIRANCQSIFVWPGDYMGGLNCHINAVNKALSYDVKDLRRDNEMVALTVTINKHNQPVIHFINAYFDTDSTCIWSYTDNTLGVWSANQTYYLIKIVYREELLDIHDIFADYRKHLSKQLSWLTRLLSDYRG